MMNTQTSKDILKKRIAVANKSVPADLVIKNGKIIDVFNQEIIHGDVAVVDGVIAGIGEFNKGEQVIDASGKYICPGFIDGHVHIESSMVTPSEFSKVVLPHGVTSVITDPHEIANVSGSEGIQYMIEDSRNSLLDVYFMLPSSVPATPFEQNGAHLNAADLEPFYDRKEVIGLAEVMDYPAVAHCSDDMIEKLVNVANRNANIDGHGAGFDIDALNIYQAAGIRTDHECNTSEEALDRVRRGMYVMIREGSASKDLSSVISAVNDKNGHRFLFCTDDKELDELIVQGSIDYNVRLSIQYGLDPIQAIQMATLNAAKCFGLENKGAVAPGYDADFLLLDNLESIQINEVYKSGECVAEKGKYLGFPYSSIQSSSFISKSVQVPDIQSEDLQIAIGTSKQAHIIEVITNSLLTKKVVEFVDVESGYFLPSLESDHVKLAVIERHNATGHVGLGIVKGLNLKSGAIASTVAHDSHNLVVAGTNDDDMVMAIDHIKELNGGLVVVNDGYILASISLGVAGLMSNKSSSKVQAQIRSLHQALEDVSGGVIKSPFSTLSFLTLPVIPAIKLTDKGLFDVDQNSHVSVGV